MKKKILRIHLTIIFIFLLIFVKAQTINSLTYRFGVKKLFIEWNTDGSGKITTDSKPETVNQFQIDLSSTVLYFQSRGGAAILQYKSIRQNDSTGVVHDLQKNTVSLFYNQYSCDLESIHHWRLTDQGEISYMILLNILKELESNPGATEITIPEIFSGDYKKLNKICQEDVLAFGGSRSMAESRASEKVNNFLRNHPDCKKTGGIDVSCLWENHVCMATQFFECNGSSCDSAPSNWCWDCGPKFL
jgi:hypothetical protein